MARSIRFCTMQDTNGYKISNRFRISRERYLRIGEHCMREKESNQYKLGQTLSFIYFLSMNTNSAYKTSIYLYLQTKGISKAPFKLKRARAAIYLTIYVLFLSVYHLSIYTISNTRSPPLYILFLLAKTYDLYITIQQEQVHIICTYRL